MRVDGRSVNEVAEGNAAVASTSPTPAAPGTIGHAQNDSVELAATAAADASKPASEVDVFLDELRTAGRGFGADFPALHLGSTYGRTPDGFSVPAGAAAQRARDYGITKPRDFVLGEIGIQLGRQRLGYNRTDFRVRDNPGLRLIVELVETIHAARAISSRFEGLREPIRAHVTTIWSAMAEKTKASGAPESIRTFVLTCMARGLGDSKPQNVGKFDEHTSKVVDAAANLFDQLTTPPTVDEQKQLDDERTAADNASAKRVDAVREKLFPLFGELVMLSMPKPEVKAAEPGKTLVSAEEAIERNKQRVAKRDQGVEKDAGADEAIAKADADRLIAAIKRQSFAEAWANPERPTPTELRRTVATLVERGGLKEPANLDRTLELTLRAAIKGSLKQTTFRGASVAANNETPWSFDFVRRLSGPDFREVLDGMPASQPIEYLREPIQQRGLGKMFEDNSKSTEAKEWVANNGGRVAEIRATQKLATDLARNDGVTASFSRALQDAQREVASAFEECSRNATVLAQGFSPKAARAFSEARGRVEQFIVKHDRIMATVRSVATSEGGAMKRLFRLAAGATAIELDNLMGGLAKVREAQEPARAYLAHMFETFPDETRALQRVLAPRLDWYATSVLNSTKSRQSDPLLPIFDGAWLGNVSAELVRAEAAAARILAYVKRLPPELADFIAIEIDSGDAFKRAMIESAAVRMAERLSGRVTSDNAAGLEVAAVQSRTLPALAARPRLAYLCNEQKVLDASGEDIRAIAPFGSLALANRDGHPGYSIDDEQRREGEDAQAARSDYNFWCRTFDLEAPAASFLSELTAWRTYHAAPLQGIIRDIEAHGGDDFERSLGDAVKLGSGRHPIEEVVGDEQRSRFMLIEQAKRRLATNERALSELAPFLDASRQPVAVLLHAVFELPKARDKDAAVALVKPWLQLSDVRLREAARKCIAEITGVKVEDFLATQLAASDAPVERLLALQDAAAIAKTESAVKVIAGLTADDDSVVRTYAAYGLSLIASQATEVFGNQVANAVTPLLGHEDPYVVQFACEAMRVLTEKGSAFAAKRVVDFAVKKKSNDPQMAALLDAIASNKELLEEVTVEARGVAVVVKKAVADADMHAPRRLNLKKREAEKKAQRDLADITVSAALAMDGEHTVDAVSDRMKLALRLVTKFEQWTTTLRPELRASLDKLDFADGIVDDAIAELAGKEPRGYLSNSPELVSELFSSTGFSAAEISILELGCVPEALVKLAANSTATDGSWRKADLTKAYNDPERYKTLVQLKLALSYDLPGIVSDVIASILAETTPPAIAAIAYGAIVAVLDCHIPLLNPTLDAEQRKKALAEAKPLDPAIDALVERAVVDRLAIVDPKSDEAKLLVDYLASGKADVAERRLSDALDRATSEPQAQLILDAARIRARMRRAQSSAKNQETIPWLISVLGAAPKANIAQVIAVRDARKATIDASDATSVVRAGERVAALATAVLDVREGMPAGELSPLLSILADSEDDGARLSKIDGLRDLMRNTKIQWSPARMTTLRNSLLVVQANQRYGDMARTLEHAIGFAGRVLAANLQLPDADMAKLFEILARCQEMGARTSYADAVVKMYRVLEPRGETLSPVFLEQMGLWLGAADNSRGGSFNDTDRKRETILNGLTELLPLSDETMTALVASCAMMTAQRTGEVLRVCKDHLRSAQLNPKDVEAIVAKGASPEETNSLFSKMLGAAVSLTAWKPSSSSFADPLEQRWNDTRDVENAKRQLRHSIGSLFDTLAAPRGESSPVAPLVISDKIGNFALGAWSRGENAARNADPAAAGAYQAGDASKLLSSGDYAAHMAAANKLRDAARDRMLDGKHPVEQIGALQLNNSRAIADAFDSLFAKSSDTTWELAHSGPRMHASNFVKANVQRMAAAKASEEAERLGLPPPPGFVSPPVFLKPIDQLVEEKTLDIFVGLILDNSQSTETENRLAYFKQLAVMMVNAFGMTRNIRIHCAVTKFSASGQLIMAPAVKHDVKTMVAALGPLSPDASTNAVDGFAKSRMASNTRKFDLSIHVMCTDGQPNDVPSTVATVELLRQDGHVVIGLGVGPDTAFLETVFGKEHSIPESDPARLAPRLYHYLKDKVLSELAS